jgi:hypothetical protein
VGWGALLCWRAWEGQFSQIAKENGPAAVAVSSYLDRHQATQLTASLARTPRPFDMPRMIRWALEPASEQMLLVLIDKGKRDARAWALAHGLPAAVKAASSGGGGVILPALR